MTNNITPIRPPKKPTNDEIFQQTLEDFRTGNHSKYNPVGDDAWNQFDVTEILQIVGNDYEYECVVGVKVIAMVDALIKNAMEN
jgi:hypothetical protein|tara:strand:+ start:598 stop:849 length:252 start_codon:yes stop_codon:yes gene_type:complete